MSMKNWRIIYKSYHDKATYYNIFKEKIRIATPIEIFVLVVILFLCLFSIFFASYDPNCDWNFNIICNQDIYLAIAIICALIEGLMWRIISNRLPIYNYKNKRKYDSYPPDVDIERYLFF